MSNRVGNAKANQTIPHIQGGLDCAVWNSERKLALPARRVDEKEMLPDIVFDNISCQTKT